MLVIIRVYMLIVHASNNRIHSVVDILRYTGGGGSLAGIQKKRDTALYL